MVVRRCGAVHAAAIEGVKTASMALTCVNYTVAEWHYAWRFDEFECECVVISLVPTAINLHFVTS